MATGLVKWWRARFLAGYRPFSVVGGNAEGSDSEELLAGAATPCNVSPPAEAQPNFLIGESTQVTVDSSVTPPPAAVNDERPTASATKQLSFEEFECDVSVAEGDRRRQEFSFTLYDFDGHGKITKDDIAGLVTTIYDTLGASIQVPPCGSKTIKVKLTVSPDQRASQTHTCLNDSQPPRPTLCGNSPCCRAKHAASCNNAATYATHGSRRVPRRRRAPRHRCQNERKEVDSHSEEEGDHARTSRVKQEEVRKRVGPIPHLQSPYSNSSEGDVSDDSDIFPAFSPLTPLLTTNQRKRSGALQRQQLLEIIQANMEKNNLSFHTSRKRHQNEHLRIPFQSPQTEPSGHYNHEHRPPSDNRPSVTAAYGKPIRENARHSMSFPKLPAKPRGNLRKARTQYGMQRNTTGPCARAPHVQPLPQPQAQPQTPPQAQLQPHPQPQSQPQPQAQPLSQTPPQPQLQPQSQPQLQPQPQPQPQPQSQPHLSARNVANLEQQQLPQINANHGNMGNLVPNNNQHNVNQSTTANHNVQRTAEAQFPQAPQCGKSSKKHQLKHATREQDQARAMAQVVRWLEREFSQGATGAASGRRHVHEHIHHHYHHYHAEALV